MPKYKPLYSLYKGLKESKYDVPDSYVSFQKTLTQAGDAGAKSRRGLYQSLKESNYDVPDTYEGFYKNLFVPVNSTTSRALKIGENPNTPAVNRYHQKLFDSVDPNKNGLNALSHRAVSQAKRAMNNVRKPVTAKVVDKKGKPTGEEFAITPAKTVEDLDREYAQETTKNWENELHDQMADADKDAAKISDMFKSFIGSMDEVGSVWGNMTRGGGIAGTPHSVTTNNGLMKNTEARQLLIAGDYNRKRRELLQLEQDSRNGAFFDNHSFFRGMYDAAKDTGFLTGGAFNLISGFTMLKTKQDLDNGVHTKAGDMLMQQAVKNSNAQSQYGDNQGWMYTGGVITTNMAPFMVQIASAGFSKGLSTSIGKVVQGAASKVALGTMKKAAGFASADLAKNIGKVTGLTTKAFGKAIQYGIVGAAQANTVGLGNVANDVINRYTGQVYQDEQGNYKFGTFDSDGNLVHEGGEDFLTALVKGEAAQTIEFATELAGGGIDAAGTALKNFVTKGGKKIINKYNMENVSKVIDFLLNNKVAKNARYLKAGADRTLGKVEVNSIVGESLEEELGIIANTVFTGDNKISDLWDEKQQSQIWGGMLLSIGLMKGAVAPFHAYNAKQYYSYKHKLNKADVNLSQLLGKEKWEELRNQIDATTNEDMPEMVNKINRDVALGKNRQPVREYIQNLLIMRGYDIGNMLAAKKAVEDKGEGVSVKNMEKNQAYQQGRDAYGYDTHEIQLDQEDKQKSLAQLLGISEQQLASMSDEELEELSGRDDNIDRAIYDYQLSTARYEGVVDNARDQIDLEVQRAAQAVDMYTDKSRNTIRNATIKATGGLEDYGVYIINGNIATHDDGSIDISNSDDMILYYDPTTNTVEHADAMMFAELGSEENADEVRSQAMADAKEKAIKETTGIIDGVVEVGTQFKTVDADGTEHTYEVLADNGDGTAMITIDGNIPTELVKGENVQVPVSFEELQKMKDESDQQRLQAAKAQREQVEKERAEQQMQAQTTQAENPTQEDNIQSTPIEDNIDYSDIIREDGKVQMVDVSDKDGNNLFPDAKDVFYIQGNKMRTKFVYIDANGELKTQSFPTGLIKIKTRGEVSVDDYKKYRNTLLSAESSAIPESSMIEDNSGENRGEIEVETPTIEGETTGSAEETAAPESAETPATEQAPATPAITLEDGTIVPMLEDGNPDFSKLSAAQTAELYDNQFGEDADSIVSGYVSDAKKALDKANNMTVKGKTFVEQKAAKAAKEKAIADAQAAYDSAIAIRDAYNERQLAKEENTPEGRKSLIEKARRKYARLKNSEEWSERPGDLWNETVGKLLHRLYDATGIDVFNDTPNTVYEYVAENVGPYSLNYEGNDNSKGVQQETGLSRSDFAKLGWLAAEGKGMTIDAKVHRLWENRPSNLESADTQEIRNALISLITSGQTAFQARDYILNQRIELAESALEEQLRQEEDAAEAQRVKEEEEDKKAELEKKAEEEKTNENRNAHELSHEQQKAKEEGEKLGFPAVDKEGEPINQNVIELANWAKEQGLEIDPTSKLNSYADLYVMCKDGFGVSTLVPDVGENINQVFYFPDNVQGEQLLKLQEEFNVGRDLKHSADMNSELTEGAMFYDGDTAREFRDFVNEKVKEESKTIEVPEDATDEKPLGEQLSEDKVPFKIEGEKSGVTYDINDKEDRKRLVAENSVDDKDILDIDMPKHVHKAIKELCKKMGLKVQFLYMGARLNGWIENGTMYLALDANKATQFVFGHEMTHAIKQKNPEAYKELVKVAMAVTTKKKFEEDLAKVYRIYHNASGYNNIDDFVEEVIADNIGKFINDYDLAQRFVLRLNHPVLATILHAIQKIKSLLYGDFYKSVDALERIVEKAYVDTAKGQVTNSETGEDVSFSLRKKPEPKKKGVGYKVFVLKDGKLYSPMVANPDGAATPVGVWLDADAAPIAGESKTGRPQVKQGGKGTQGGSGKLAYRPGWHLGVVPYAIQFNRKDAEGNKTLFPKNFVFAEVEYAADVDYQEEARQEGINPSGKYQHSLAGLKHLPTDGYYMYRTNPNPETDPWVITGAMKVNRILTRAEQAELVKNAGREPQQIQEGDIVTDDVVNSINQEIADVPKFSLKVYHGSGADFTEFDFNHMGEGAGSQAFGWGGYVTSSKKIGKSYAKIGQMSAEDIRRHASSEDTPIEAAVGSILGQEIYNSRTETFEQKKAQAIKNAENSIASYSDMLKNSNELDEKSKKFLEKSIERYKEELEVLRALTEEQYKEEYIKQGRAKNLYDVDIPDDNGDYLDWDAPLTDKQKNTIIKELRRLKIDFADFKKRGFSFDGSFGGNAYDFLMYALRRTKKWKDVDASRAVSKFLSSIGFTGIKYKAGTISGGAEEGDTNYVIFKPEDMRITEHTKFSIKTYHGSQASFDKFDHSFMGSGEGAQAYGWGTYVSEVEGIAKAYAKQNAKKNAPSRLMYQGKPMTYKTPSIIYQVALDMDKFNISAKEAISKMIDADEKKLASVGDTPFAKMKAKQVQDELNVLKGLNPSDFKINEDYDTVAQNLADTKSGLDLLEDELKDAKSYVDLYQSRLDEAKGELSKAKESGTGLGVDMYESDVMYYSEQVEKYKQNVKTKESDIKDVKTKIDALQKKLDSIGKPRNLYSVDIPDDTGENYIGWDEPITPKMLEAKRLVMEEDGYTMYDSDGNYDYFEKTENGKYQYWQLWNRQKGNGLYNELSQVLHSDKLASLALNKQGIVGVKVIADRTTGGNKEGKMNYVIFDENNAQITNHTKFSLRLKSAIEETETNPSDAQKESGNYKKGHIKFGGYDYTIENPKGSTRSGKDANGKEWKVTMHDTYGYIRGKFGKDGDHLDMFINDKADLDNWNGDVFVVDQVNPDGSFDEHKVMYGYDSMDDAEKAYLANYSKGWKGLGNITGASKDEFDKWLDTSNRKLKPFADYANVKFSQAQSVSEPRYSLKDKKTLAGVHNITEEKLLKAIKQGGLANPSVAVIDSSKQNHEDYGDISLILPSEKVAKRTGKNAGTWQGDAWTPTYPQVERQMSNKGAAKASKDVSSVPGDMYREVRRGLDRWLDGGEANSAMAYMFLSEKGVAPEPKKIQHKFGDDVYNELKSITTGDFNIYGIGKADAQKVLDMYIDAKFDGDKDLYEEKTKAWLERNNSIVDAGDKGGMRYTIAKDNVELYDEYGFNYKSVQTFVRDVEYDHRKTGVDMNATLNDVEDYIKTNNLTDEFNTWLEGKEKEYGIKEVIFDGFTPSGNRRYVPNTLENVSKIMKKQGRNGATGISVSFQNFAASLMPSYGTLKDIRSKKGLLTSDYEDLDKFNEKWSKVFFELGMKCQPDATGTFDDYGLARLSEAAKTSDPQAYLKKEYNVDFSDEDTKRLKEMVKAIKEESPAMYFETKFERPVGFNEFSSAVVPTTASDEVKQALQNAGVQIYEYDKEKEGDRSRAFNEAINSSDNIRFSLKQTNDKFNSDLKSYVENGVLPENSRFELGFPSDILLSAGFPKLPISMRVSLLNKKAGMERHPFSPTDLYNLVDAIQEPLAIFEYTKPNMRNLIVDLTKGEKHFLVGVTLDYRKGDLAVNSISGLFPKENHEWIKWIQDGKAIRIDKKDKVLSLINSLQTNPEEAERIGLNLDFAAKIIKYFENPSVSSENTLSDTKFSLRGSTTYDKQMEERMEKNHLEKGAVPMEKPIMKEGENIFDYANRMVEWTRNQNLWKTAPKQTGFQDALDKWKADNGLSPDAYPPVRPHRENYSTEIGYTEDLEEYNKKKEIWKSAPKPKDFDLSVDLEDMNKQLRNIRRAVLNQKNYDQRTVKAVSDLVRKMLNIGWGDGLSRGKVGNLLSAAKNATGANDVKKYLDKAMGILAENYLNRLSTAYDNLINTKGARADQSGVIKMGSLDAKGQAFMSEYKKAMNMDDSSLNTYIANIEEDSAKNEDNVEMNDYRLAGIQAAIMYKQQIGGNDADIAELKRQIGELKNKKDATEEDKDLLKSLEKKLFENKFDRITMYENLLNNIQRMVKESKGRAKEFRDKITEHKNEILHRANLDLEGVDSTYYDTTTAKKKFVNNDLQRAVFSSTYTFEQFLKFFGKHSANGEGRLYNYFHKLNQDALDEEQLYNEMNRNALDEKTKELFGKEKFMKLVGIDSKGMKEMDIEVTDYSNKKTGKRTIHLKQGQMLYIYLVNKETDGEMKLRAMGITEEDVAAIEENLDPRVKAMGVWLQDEYLPECQRRYQATHTKYFGAPMKEVENYFPLAINNRARNVKEDVNQDSDAMSQLAGTSTGAIVTRRVNVIPLDIENADAFEVAFNHLQEMEEWSAMLPFRQDINTLLSYTHFRNQVQNMSSVAYGSGKTLWDEFKQTAQIAAGTYKPKVNAGMMDSRIAAAMGGIAVAKISGRLWTAIKQSQSATVFLPECDFTRFVKNGVNPYGSWKWAMETIPDFRKRVENMTYGDVKLRQYLDELEKWHDWTKTISKIGMAPNILVDGITCAVGARSVYETEVNRLTKLGYPKDKADEKAYYKAVAAYNKTQQSSGGMYLSPMQVDRTYVSAALSLFKNANYAYGRMQIEACRGLARTYDFWGGKHKTTLIESMTRQIMGEDGLNENTARTIAKATYNRTFRQSIGRLINFATLIPVTWALYKVLPYLLTGDDDDKKKDMIEEAVLKGFVTSLSDNYVIPFVSNILNAGLKVEDGKPTFDPEVFRYQNLYINPATSDLANIYSMVGNQKWYSVVNKLGMLGVQSLIGFNPETVGALYQAFAEADYDNGNTAKEWQIGTLKAISAPEESIRELYMDELGLKSGDIKKIPLAELEKRYAERQINRDNLLSQIGMDSETFNGYVDKYQKSFEKKIKDKMDKWDEYDKKKADEFFDTTSDPKLKDMIEKKRAKDANAAADEQIAKEGLSQEKKGKELNEEAYDAVKVSIDVAEDNAISTYNKVLNKRYAALNDEYNEQTDAMKYIFMSKHPNFKAYKDLKSEYTTYGKKIKKLKEKLVSADGYDAKQTILKQIRAEREKFSKLQSKVR